MAVQLDEALAALRALRALVDAGRATYNDYCEEVWGPRDDLRQAVALGAQVLAEALCPTCNGLGYVPEGGAGCTDCGGGKYGRLGDGLARPVSDN